MSDLAEGGRGRGCSCSRTALQCIGHKQNSSTTLVQLGESGSDENEAARPTSPMHRSRPPFPRFPD